ncbi:FAD-binding oxidoreductase [Patescibacteria group bacterium]|nr:MAG: FAD-binding oxidoreductase [Patescibacteria group bacterium]
MNQKHEEVVKQLQKQIGGYFAHNVAFRVYHGSTNSTRVLTFKRSEMVDTSKLNHVLSVDVKKRVVVVEPNVSMDKLVDATLKYGLVPPVVPEFPGITVGGGIQGGAGESSSFKWGFFSQTVNWIEYILADGSKVKTSPIEHADLFYGAAGSSGTLGVITAVEVQLIPAKKYVQLTYIPVRNFKDSLQIIENETIAKHDFIDGIMFGKNHGCIIVGKLSDEKVGKLKRFSRAIDPWYYLHAQQIDSNAKTATETVPIRDYLFRYNRGAFWVGKYAFARFNLPFNALTRFILNPMLNTRKLYQALQDSGASQEHIVQDLSVPLNRAEKLMDYIDTKTSIYPLWLCPIKPELRSPLLCNALDTSLVINIGVWGPQIANYDLFKKLNRDIEKNLAKLDGKKWMYAHTYYTEKEFWSIYDKNWYDNLRRKYKATNLPSVYEKVRVRDQLVVNARRGALKTLIGRAKLRIED